MNMRCSQVFSPWFPPSGSPPSLNIRQFFFLDLCMNHNCQHIALFPQKYNRRICILPVQGIFYSMSSTRNNFTQLDNTRALCLFTLPLEIFYYFSSKINFEIPFHYISYMPFFTPFRFTKFLGKFNDSNLLPHPFTGFVFRPANGVTQGMESK